MTIPRSQQICLEQTPYYHCISRCVRRAYLCGLDVSTGQSFHHRRQWVEESLNRLCQVFCIELVAYAIMDNHYHVIFKVNAGLAHQLSDAQVVTRWGQLYRIPPAVQRLALDPSLSADEAATARRLITEWREQLVSISRLMGYLNERIARRANQEDQCTGRFWEGRFKSQALLDERALIECMAYVDLNPVRAGTVETPERAQHTSLRRRLDSQSAPLVPFMDERAGSDSLSADPHEETLPLTLGEYVSLVDWTGRQVRDDKRGAIASQSPPILDRLGVSSADWLQSMSPRRGWMGRAAGATDVIRAYCQAIGLRWIWQQRPTRSTAPPTQRMADLVS